MNLFSSSSSRLPSQLIYSLLVIVLVPTFLIFNTFFLLRTFRRDTDFELNNKALLLASSLALHTRTSLSDSPLLSQDLADLTSHLPEIKAVDIFVASGSGFTSLASTSKSSSRFTDPVLNSLAWGSSQSYSKQILADFPPDSPGRVWLVVTPIMDSSGQKLGLVNLYLSASVIDAVTARTRNDALIILSVTTLLVILLLLNHLRLFQISLWFKKLKEIDELKDNFISVASHELRTPLSIISNYSYLLLKRPEISAHPEIADDFSAIQRSVDRLKDLVADMLDVSRIEQNRITLHPSPQNLGDLVTQTVADLTPQAAAKSLKLEYQPFPSALTVSVDPDKMRQILINLIGNAIKYTPTGSVTVSHQVKNNLVKTYIADTGVGISAEDRARLFTKFYRIQSDLTRDIPGTGLGLWITKQLVEKMGGQITLDSIEGKGSQFIIALPLAKPPS